MIVFAYGTLMDKPLVERMLGHEVDMTQAWLYDYVRLQPSFYMIFPHKGKEVEGVVIWNLSDQDVARFDRYEGNGFGYYDRQTVKVIAYGEGPTEAEAYVGGPHMKWFYDNWLEEQEPNH